MQSKLLKGLFNSLLAVVALCVLGMVVWTVAFFFGLTTLQLPSADRAAEKPLQTTAPHPKAESPAQPASTPALPTRHIETVKRNDAQKELDRQFKQFLTEQGLSTDDVQAALDAPVPVKQRDDDVPEAQRLDPHVVEQLKADYPVADARRKHEGEVWLQMDPAEAEGLSMDELMARAADLCGDSVSPIKVVVWVGNRPRAIQTFNGAPMF